LNIITIRKVMKKLQCILFC